MAEYSIDPFDIAPIVDSSRPPRAILDTRHYPRNIVRAAQEFDIGAFYKSLFGKGPKGDKSAFYKMLEGQGFDIEFVDSEKELDKYGLGKVAGIQDGKKLKVAKKIGDYQLSEDELFAALAHEYFHFLKPAEGVQKSAERFLKENGYEGPANASAKITKSLAEMGELH